MSLVRTKQWVSESALVLALRYKTDDPELAMRKAASELLDRAGFSEPPFDPEILASFQGVARVLRLPIKEAARLVPSPNGLEIHVNTLHSVGRQNFSIDHETSHTFFPTYWEKPTTKIDKLTGTYTPHNEEEYLCDIGASQLLLDERWLRPRALEYGPSSASLSQLADDFGASLEATAVAIGRLSLWPCAVVFWEESLKPSQSKLKLQTILPGLEDMFKIDEELRARLFCAPPGFPIHLWKYKSIPRDTSIYECLQSEDETEGRDLIGDGRQCLKFYVCSKYIPYRVGEVTRRRVVSLLFPAEN